MPAPENRLKSALQSGKLQFGMWLALASPTVAEMAAGCGFDWCLIDAEHGPNSIPLILAQLQAMGTQKTSAVVRVPIGEEWMLKQVLDLGAQTVLVPMVETGEQAAGLVQAVRYPPAGRRGLGSALARASGYNAIADYPDTANDQICLIVQAESRAAIENIDDIAETPGVDAVFIGPYDLSADMGYLGQPEAPEVMQAIEHAIGRIRRAGKAVGLLDFNPEHIAAWQRRGVTFLAVQSDVTALGSVLREIAKSTRAKLA